MAFTPTADIPMESIVTCRTATMYYLVLAGKADCRGVRHISVLFACLRTYVSVQHAGRKLWRGIFVVCRRQMRSSSRRYSADGRMRGARRACLASHRCCLVPCSAKCMRTLFDTRPKPSEYRNACLMPFCLSVWHVIIVFVLTIRRPMGMLFIRTSSVLQSACVMVCRS